MHPSSQSIDTTKLKSYISLSSPKLKSSSNPLVISIQKIMKLQQLRFDEINKGCEFMQSYISNIQQMVEKLQQRMTQINQSQSTQTIFNLKNKQNQFIIHQLKDKIKKLQSNQQSYSIEIRHLKKQLDLVKRQQKQTINKQQLTNNRLKQQQFNKLRQDYVNMQKIIKQKDIQISQLNKKLSRLQKQQKLTSSITSSVSISSNMQKIKRQKQQDYKLLQNKLLQLQKQFQVKVTSLHQEVKEKTMKIKDLDYQMDRKQKQYDGKVKQYQNKIKDLSLINNNNDNINSNNNEQKVQNSQKVQNNNSYMKSTFNPFRQSFSSLPSSTQQSPSQYELQLKLSHQQNLYKQLQQQYTNHLTTANNLQIQLHQQIHSQKTQLQQEKKKHKTQKKHYIQLLHSLASHINKRTFNYFDNNIDNIIEELKKIYNKQKQRWEKELQQYKKVQQQQKDKIIQLQRDHRKTKNQTQLQKQQIQNLKQQVLKLQTQRDKQRKLKRQNSSQITETNQTKKSSLNGSLGQISNNKSQTPSLVQEKYKSIIDSLRQQIQQKQQHITELENLQTIDFQKSKQKILSIESQLADARNQNKKQQREIKDLKQKIIQLIKQSQKLKTTLQQTKQKHIKDKQLSLTQHQQKMKTLQQKITKLKDQNQHIDSKCQQKVMKYNKLKTKLQKLQMYNNQTEKRKDTQIQQLIKKNQQIKMECKLLQEKLNIAQALQSTTSGQDQNAVKTTFGYNKDLIEQIQMERDRILEQYQNKRREYLKLKETTDKLQEENSSLKEKVEKNQQQKQKKDQQRQTLQQQKQNILAQNQRFVNKLSQEKQSLSSQVFDLKKQLTQLKEDNESLKKQVSKLQEQISNKSKQQYQYLKKELQSQLQLRKKKEKQEQALVSRIKQLKEENQRLKKDMQQKTKGLQAKWMQKLKEKSASYHEEVSKLKDEHNKKVKDLEQKLSVAAIREENLVNIINYKNLSVSGNIRQSMRGQEEYAFEEGQEMMNKQLVEDEVQHVEEYNFMVKHKVETVDQQISTETRNQHLEFSQLQHVHISPHKVLKELSFQKIQAIQIISNKQFTNQQTNINIFESQQQLIQLLKEIYPHIIQTLVTSKKNEQQEEKLQFFDNQLEKVDVGINTQHQARLSTKKSQNAIAHTPGQGLISNRNSINQRDSINILKSTIKGSSFLLESEILASGDHSRSSVEQTPITDSDFINIHTSPRQKFDPQSNKVQQINLFENLKPSNLNLQIDQDNLDDNFEICQQGESINVGQTALNLQIKEIFNKLREQLEKVFNGEDISLSMIKILPRQLEDDYNEFIVYVKEKIQQIKNQNQLSFIMAEVGDSPQQIDQELDMELQNFADKKITQDIFAYKKLVQQKQALITSLMNEKTLQQNTINQMTMQQQEVQEEHENRFMNQCIIYKKEIKELKNKVDTLQMNFQSLKNIFKNTMEIWVDQIQNEDDLRDNFTIYKNIAKLNQLESTRLNYYIFRYKEIKNITD